MEHIGHFPTSMEMCIDDHLTLTTEKIQQKQFQSKAYEQCCSTHSISPHSQKNTVLSHAKFPTGMESMPFFLGNKFLQGKEKSTLKTKLKPFMNTGTFTLGMINFLNRYSALSTLTHQVIDYNRLRKSTAQGNQFTRLSSYTSTGFPCDKKDLPTDLHESWNHRETLSIKSRITAMMNNIMNTICMILMSEHSSDSISNRLAQPGKNALQKKYITRLKGYNNIDQLCNRENLLTDLPESWPYKEPLHNRSRLISYGDTCQYVHKEFYILPRPSEAMTQLKFQYMQKEVYILSRPSKLQPMTDYSIAPQHAPREKDLPPPLSMLVLCCSLMVVKFKSLY